MPITPFLHYLTFSSSATVTNTFNAAPCLLIQAHRLLISAKIIEDQLHNASISSRHAFFDLDLCTAKF
jgi:hypothetical protein